MEYFVYVVFGTSVLGLLSVPCAKFAFKRLRSSGKLKSYPDGKPMQFDSIEVWLNKNFFKYKFRINKYCII